MSTQEAALLSILANHTTSPPSWFVLWWGDYHGNAVISEESLLENDHAPSSDYCIFTGPHRAWKDFWSYPPWWWPEDRSWCWHTGLDLDVMNWDAPTSVHPTNASRRTDHRSRECPT